jgi:hypothetical protein
LLFSKEAGTSLNSASYGNSLHAPKIEGILTLRSALHAVAVGDMKKSRWLWPLGLIATGLAGAGVVIFRGCWHRNLSWPVRFQDYSYQVCLGCGIKRLFDETAFRAYGPFSYDLDRLIAWDQARESKLHPEIVPAEHRTAS